MNKFKELVAKLREILQIDRPELDFGIYRIINARAMEIDKFLNETLPGKIHTALSSGKSGDLVAKQQALQNMSANLQDAGVDPQSSPKYIALQAEITQLQSGSVDYEGRTYAHLLNFFSRYYDKGDFISKRRYKADTYAVPYSGEEVLLYWANFDQYYTKSGENFSNYTIKLDDTRKVHFRLVAADTAKDNRKDNDLERCFVLVKECTITRTNADGEEVEETIMPVGFGTQPGKFDDLVIKFEYLSMPKGTKQSELVIDAVKQIFAAPDVLKHWPEIAQLCPTEKNRERTRLEKELNDYVSKNKADYFIHKDLGTFLRRELDFYIKNEMLHLDDIQHIDAFREIEKNLKMIQCMRTIAGELITFMAQLEDFQKKLWLKKKFVTQCDYCMTLDRVPEQFYHEILNNEAQIAEWKRLTLWTADVPSAFSSSSSSPDVQQTPWIADVPSASSFSSPDISTASLSSSLSSNVSALSSPRSVTAPMITQMDLWDVAATDQWKSRGYLPHFDSGDVLQFITIRLADSVPTHVVQAWKQELDMLDHTPDPDSQKWIELQRKISEYEDAGYGECLLRDSSVAEMCLHALKFHDGIQYDLFAWSIMPNHMHMLIRPKESLGNIIHSLKSFTAHEANKILNRKGEFWFKEYFDRFIRNQKHYRFTLNYILNNPKKSGYTTKFTGSVNDFSITDEVAEEGHAGIGGEASQANAGGTPALHSGMTENAGNMYNTLLDEMIENAAGTAALHKKTAAHHTLHHALLHKSLMIDTKFFGEDFKARLLAEIPDLDAQCDGLLIHSENFQALNLLQERYREQVKCIYIDPPYNTGNDGFIYRDSYQHSSWLTMMHDRLIKAKNTMPENGIIFISIDDNEVDRLKQLCNNVFGENNLIASYIKQSKVGGGSDSKFIVKEHEYCLVYAKNFDNADEMFIKHNAEYLKRYKEKDETGRFFWDTFARPGLKNPIYYDIIAPDGKVMNNGWIHGKERFEKELKSGIVRIIKKSDGGWSVQFKQYCNENGKKPRSMTMDFGGSIEGKNDIASLFFDDKIFSYPKASKYISTLINTILDNEFLILDYFAGSGTTAHAVINLNREDGGKRKYILVEMGDHFDNVLKPRIQKVVFSEKWKDGKPVGVSGGVQYGAQSQYGAQASSPASSSSSVSSIASVADLNAGGTPALHGHCFKYMRLESYEDTLNNLALSRSEVQQDVLDLDDALKTEYLLKYMLDIESRSSLLSTDHFQKPFKYRLNIAVDSAGATQPMKIDLVETFNYLIGLRVKHHQYWPVRGICIIEGTLPNGENTLILWRDCEKVDYDALNKFCESMGINPRESIYDCVYVNGDNSIPNQTQSLESEGGITKVLKLRRIEEEFLTRMFEEV